MATQAQNLTKIDYPSPWMTTEETAQYLKVCRQTLYELVDSKLLPCRKLSPRNFRFKRPEVDAWLERKRR